jgi:hypothetical protein
MVRTVGKPKAMIIVLLVALGIALIVGLVLGLRGCGCDGAETTTTTMGTETTVAVAATTITTTTSELSTTTTNAVVAHKRTTATTGVPATAPTTTVPTTQTTAANPFAGTHTGYYRFGGESRGTIVFVVSTDGSLVGSGTGALEFTIYGAVAPSGSLAASGSVDFDGPTTISFTGALTDGGANGAGSLFIDPETSGLWAVPDAA